MIVNKVAWTVLEQSRVRQGAVSAAFCTRLCPRKAQSRWVSGHSAFPYRLQNGSAQEELKVLSYPSAGSVYKIKHIIVNDTVI